MRKPRKPKSPPSRDPRLRSAAEAQLARPGGAPPKRPPKGAPELVHELQVHQIEMEMQNEELQQARLALEESRDRYQDLYDFGPVGYMTFTREGLILEVNLTGAALLGLERAKLVGRKLGSFVAREDQDRWERHLASLLRRAGPAAGPGQKQSCELKFQRADGSAFHACLESVWLTRPGGQKSAGAGLPRPIIRTALSNITERKQAEEALRRSREDLDRAQAVGQIGSWRLDIRRNVLSWSDENHRIFGVPKGTPLSYESFLAIVHPEDRQRVDTHWQAALRGEPYDLEHRLVVAGEIRWVRERAYLERDASGALLGGFGITQDITAWKRVEAALAQARANLEERVRERTAELRQANQQLRQEIEVRRQAERELFEAELRYRTVADFTHDWEYWETPECVLRYCSPSCERITGYAAREFMANPTLLQQIVHPEDVDLWQKHREETRTGPGPRAVQFRVRCKDGNIRWVEHACQPVVGEDGVFLGIRGSNRDITSRKEKELQNQQLRKELAHVTRVITAGQLAASLAHELNQPLAAILCNVQTAAQFLAADPPNVAEVQEVLDDIAHDSERAGGVIQRLRALFNKTGHERSVLQINEIIHETLDLLRSEFVFKGITTQVMLDPALPKVLGNRIELQQVVLNLTVNATDAMSECEPGQRHLGIATGCEGYGEIRVSVRDSGTGIRVQPTNRLFEPFFTTKAGGMGMGLAISQSILEAHGGRLSAVNNPDQGATFQITLPIHHGEPA